jgi:hypothetical protein
MNRSSHQFRLLKTHGILFFVFFCCLVQTAVAYSKPYNTVLIFPVAIACEIPPTPFVTRFTSHHLNNVMKLEAARRQRISLILETVSYMQSNLASQFQHDENTIPLVITEHNIVSKLWKHPSPLQGKDNIPDILPFDQAKPEINMDYLQSVLKRYNANSAIAAGIDHIENVEGAGSPFWVRMVFFCYKANGILSKPFYIYGKADPGFLYMFKHSHNDEVELMHRAVQNALSHVSTLWQKEQDMPFAHNVRVAVLRSLTPDTYVYSKSKDEGSSSDMPIAEIGRQSDVLFQPDVGPVNPIILPWQVHSITGPNDLSKYIFRKDGSLNLQTLSMIAHNLNVKYLFFSKVDSILVIDIADAIKDGDNKITASGRTAEATVTGGLYDTETGSVLWKVTKEATVKETPYAGGKKRELLSPNKCAMDAVRLAFAYLRFDFNSFQQKIMPTLNLDSQPVTN